MDTDDDMEYEDSSVDSESSSVGSEESFVKERIAERIGCFSKELFVKEEHWKIFCDDPYIIRPLVYCNKSYQLLPRPSDSLSCEPMEYTQESLNVEYLEEDEAEQLKVTEYKLIDAETFAVFWHQIVLRGNIDVLGSVAEDDLVDEVVLCEWLEISTLLHPSYQTVTLSTLDKILTTLTQQTVSSYAENIKMYNWLSFLTSNFVTFVFNRETCMPAQKDLLKGIKKYILCSNDLYNKHLALPNNIETCAFLTTVSELNEMPDNRFLSIQEDNALLSLYEECCRREEIEKTIRLFLVAANRRTNFFSLVSYRCKIVNELKYAVTIFQAIVSNESAKLKNWEYALKMLLKVFPALLFVLQNKFESILPQTMDISDYDSVLDILIRLNKQDVEEKFDSFELRDDCYVAVSLYKVLAHGNMEPLLVSLRQRREHDIRIKEIKFDILAEHTNPELYLRGLFEFVTETECQRGETLFALARYLHDDEYRRHLFPQYEEKVRDIFCSTIDSLITSGTLLIYYLIFKPYLSAVYLSEIETKLKERIAAEDLFQKFFLQEVSRSISMPVRKFPCTFFHSFKEIFLYHTYHKKDLDASKNIEALIEALEKFPVLKTKLIRGKANQNELFREVLSRPLTERGRSEHRHQLQIICSGDWGRLLASRGQLRLESYEKKTLNILKELSYHPETKVNVALARTPCLPLDVVAKYFAGPLHHLAEGYDGQIRTELQNLLTLQCNPFIITIYGYIVTDDRIIGILMEYCRGGSLTDVIKKRYNYAKQHIMFWILQAACGLKFLHANNLVHRDVNPNNMLLDKEYHHLKIADFGLNKVGVVKDGECSFEYSSDTGTPGYRAPEIEKDVKAYTKKVDTFAIGRTCWKLMYRGHRLEEDIICTTVTCPGEILPDVLTSEEIWEYTIVMMSEDPTKRQTMSEVYEFFYEQHQLLEKSGNTEENHPDKELHDSFCRYEDTAQRQLTKRLL